MSPVDVHVIPLAQGWEVRRAGGRVPISTHQTRSSAVKAGRVLAESTDTELIVHAMDGVAIPTPRPA